MREFGWTIDQVMDQPYETLCRMIIEKGEHEETRQEEKPKVYTGSNLRQLFGG